MDKETKKYIKLVRSKASKNYGVISNYDFDGIVPLEYRRTVVNELHNDELCVFVTHGIQFMDLA